MPRADVCVRVETETRLGDSTASCRPRDTRGGQAPGDLCQGSSTATRNESRVIALPALKEFRLEESPAHAAGGGQAPQEKEGLDAADE